MGHCSKISGKCSQQVPESKVRCGSFKKDSEEICKVTPKSIPKPSSPSHDLCCPWSQTCTALLWKYFLIICFCRRSRLLQRLIQVSLGGGLRNDTPIEGPALKQDIEDFGSVACPRQKHSGPKTTIRVSGRCPTNHYHSGPLVCSFFSQIVLQIRK